MRYYVDFDRTIFDTDAFITYLKDRDDTKAHTELPEMELAAVLDAMAVEGSLRFELGELSRFLYPDAASFLREKENAVTIITFGNKHLQEIKIKSVLYGIPRMSVMYTGDVRKGAYLAPHTHLHADALLIDDSPLELEVLARECPSLALFEMRRDGGAGDGRWPVVGSLAELP